MKKLQYKASPKVIIEADGEDDVSIFEGLATLAGVFAHADKCGLCECPMVVPQKRTTSKGAYYEFKCLNPNCGATIQVHQHKPPAKTMYVGMDDRWSIYQPAADGGGSGYDQGNQQQSQAGRGQQQQRGGGQKQEIPF